MKEPSYSANYTASSDINFFLDEHLAAIKEVGITVRTEAPKYVIRIIGDIPQSVETLSLQMKNEDGDLAELSIHNLKYISEGLWETESIRWWHWIDSTPTDSTN
jgi:hypothetical protein